MRRYVGGGGGGKEAIFKSNIGQFEGVWCNGYIAHGLYWWGCLCHFTLPMSSAVLGDF